MAFVVDFCGQVGAWGPPPCSPAVHADRYVHRHGHAVCRRRTHVVRMQQRQETTNVEAPVLVTPQQVRDCELVPLSFDAAVEQMRASVQRALDQGYTRLLVEVDTTVGDETYTSLKNSIPLVKASAKLLSEGRVQFPQGDEKEQAETGSMPSEPSSAEMVSESDAASSRKISKGGSLFEVPDLPATKSNRPRVVKIVLPDSGAAALLQRDWEKEGQDMTCLRIVGFENQMPAEDDEAFVIAVPRASEVGQLELFVNEAAPMYARDARPTIIINPDFVDMGVTGLGLAARQLRTRFLSTLESAFYLKSLPWGVLLRAYPKLWAVYQDDPTLESQFRLIAAQPKRPSSDELEDFLDAANPQLAKQEGGGVFSKLGKFLQMYMKG